MAVQLRHVVVAADAAGLTVTASLGATLRQMLLPSAGSDGVLLQLTNVTLETPDCAAVAAMMAFFAAQPANVAVSAAVAALPHGRGTQRGAPQAAAAWLGPQPYAEPPQRRAESVPRWQRESSRDGWQARPREQSAAGRQHPGHPLLRRAARRSGHVNSAWLARRRRRRCVWPGGARRAARRRQPHGEAAARSGQPAAPGDAHCTPGASRNQAARLGDAHADCPRCRSALWMPCTQTLLPNVTRLHLHQWQEPGMDAAGLVLQCAAAVCAGGQAPPAPGYVLQVANSYELVVSSGEWPHMRVRRGVGCWAGWQGGGLRSARAG